MFTYQKKRFVDNSDDDDEGDDDHFENDNKNATKKRKISRTANVKPKKQHVPVADDDEDEGDDCVVVDKVLAAKDEVKKLLSESNFGSNVEPVNVVVDDDEKMRAAKTLLSQIGLTMRQVSNVDDDVTTLPVQESTLILPTVRRRKAAERAVRPEDSISEMLLNSVRNCSSSSGSSDVAPPVDTGGARIGIKTRLNGLHLRLFKVAIDAKFEVVRDGLARMYDIPASFIVMKFDGDSIDDNQTPEELDMEEDNMIDVSIPKEKYEAAVAASLTAKDRKGNTGEADIPTIAGRVLKTPELPSKQITTNQLKAASTESIIINIFVPSTLAVDGSCPVEFDVTVFKSHTLQSLHDVLMKQKNLKLGSNVSYVLSTKLNDDLDLSKTFNDFGMMKDSTLVVRFKPVSIMFRLDGITNVKTNCLIVEPVTVKLRLDTVFSKTANSMASHVGVTSDKLDFFFNGNNLESSKEFTLIQIGITNASEIIVKLRS